jgi:hypothetical protein
MWRERAVDAGLERRLLVLSEGRTRAKERRDRDRSETALHHFNVFLPKSPRRDVRSGIVE